MEIKKMKSLTTELFERIAEVRKDENAIEYMVGVETVDGRKVAFHTVKYIDCDISTGNMIGMVEYDGKIELELIPRKMVLYRVA